MGHELGPLLGKPLDFSDLLAGLAQNETRAKLQFAHEYYAGMMSAARRVLPKRDRGDMDKRKELCHATLVKFFERAAREPLDLAHPGQLTAYLATMIEHEFLHELAHSHAQKCDKRRLERQPVAQFPVPARVPDPSEAAAGKEIRERCLAELSAEERQILLAREAGQKWRAIGAPLGLTPAAARMRFQRAFDRLRAMYERLTRG